MYPDLAGKVAIVTGAGSGIGEATARRLAAEGAAVLVADINADAGTRVADSIISGGGVARFCACDVSTEDDTRRVVEAAVTTFGRLDLAANVAGTVQAEMPLEETPVEDFDRAYRVNQRGLFLSMRAEIPAMLQNGQGAIVNVASLAGLRAYDGLSGYVASKYGAVGVTLNAASELVGRNVRVNVVAPGATLTPMLLGKEDNSLAHITANQPMKRFGDPAELANVIAFLLSAQASFVTGAVLPVDGGWLSRGDPNR